MPPIGSLAKEDLNNNDETLHLGCQRSPSCVLNLEGDLLIKVEARKQTVKIDGICSSIEVACSYGDATRDLESGEVCRERDI